jgi:hypothetical protein
MDSSQMKSLFLFETKQFKHISVELYSSLCLLLLELDEAIRFLLLNPRSVAVLFATDAVDVSSKLRVSWNSNSNDKRNECIENK